MNICHHTNQWRSQNVKKVKHTKGRLLEQAVILFHCVPFHMGSSLKGKKLLPEEEEFFPLRAVPYGMEITFATLGDLP